MTRAEVGPFGPIVAGGSTAPNSTFACPVPTKKGARPANSKVVGSPPKVTVGANDAVESGLAEAGVPVAGALVTPPTPVK